MTRRNWLQRLSALAFGPAVATTAYAAADTPAPAGETDWRRLSDDEWKRRLNRDQYRVLRREGTEPAFSSTLDNEKRAGIYQCAGCALPLFSSDAKFDSGTGWPSFHTALPGALGTKTDYKIFIPRTEYHCARCGGHQGHVFDDGPPPTGKRYCNNGVALRFVAAES
ncbi:MAG TPA: peptide-methionine (R)-S-oxide reductase MsrB [Rubrivivax sp.]|nr:peptide-methionine (R)-S-oxide reductase MsrB [Rubrivivax sp.]